MGVGPPLLEELELLLELELLDELDELEELDVEEELVELEELELLDELVPPFVGGVPAPQAVSNAAEADSRQIRKILFSIIIKISRFRNRLQNVTPRR